MNGLLRQLLGRHVLLDQQDYVLRVLGRFECLQWGGTDSPLPLMPFSIQGMGCRLIIRSTSFQFKPPALRTQPCRIGKSRTLFEVTLIKAAFFPRSNFPRGISSPQSQHPYPTPTTPPSRATYFRETASLERPRPGRGPLSGVGSSRKCGEQYVKVELPRGRSGADRGTTQALG